ncbi:MAG: nucleotidyltransferase domain-containing protein [Clostridia bacterium]|nr:MAG: nucleotidyltransferase domain-containing protein [Clostridia bacterium]
MSRGLSERESQAIKEFCRLVREKLGSDLKEVRLFGSKARGTSGPESDIDVLLITAGKDRSLEEIVIEAAVEVNLEHDVFIAPLVIPESRYYSPLYRETLLFKTTQEEGVSL